MMKKLLFTAAALAAAALMTAEASARDLVIGLSYGKTGRYSSGVPCITALPSSST